MDPVYAEPATDTLTKCPDCGAVVTSQIVKSAIWHEDRLVVIEDVPALICSRCYEEYYSQETSRQIDLLRQAGFPAERAIGELRARVFALKPEQIQSNMTEEA